MDGSSTRTVETIFGSSNWTSASATSQAEHNYFTVKTAIFNWFSAQFDRMWNNTNPSGIVETVPFVPKPPDGPNYRAPANAASVTTATAAGSCRRATFAGGRTR